MKQQQQFITCVFMKFHLFKFYIFRYYVTTKRNEWNFRWLKVEKWMSIGRTENF